MTNEAQHLEEKVRHQDWAVNEIRRVVWGSCALERGPLSITILAFHFGIWVLFLLNYQPHCHAAPSTFTLKSWKYFPADSALAMSAPRVFVRSSRLFSRGCAIVRPALLSTRHVLCQRQFTASARLREDLVETPSRGAEVLLTSFTNEPTGSHARSVAIFKLPARATRADIEALFQSKGLEMYVTLPSQAPVHAD